MLSVVEHEKLKPDRFGGFTVALLASVSCRHDLAVSSPSQQAAPGWSEVETVFAGRLRPEIKLSAPQ